MTHVDQLLNQLIWKENSKQMYEAILKQMPMMFQPAIKKKIVGFIMKQNIHIVTEAVVFQAIQEIAPPDTAQMIQKKLQVLKTKSSIDE